MINPRRNQTRIAISRRKLLAQQLEPRHMLAAFLVTNTDDDGTGSLRMAIEQANTNGGPDTITFDASVFTGGDTSLIRLSRGELEITGSLTIDATNSVDVTITGDAADDDWTDAANITDVAASGDGRLDDNSRVLNFSAATGDLTLEGLTLTGGRTTGNNVNIPGQGYETTHSGGGIRFLSSGVLTLAGSTLRGNSTAGNHASGGGIWTSSGAVTITGGTLSGNRTEGDDASGGGIWTSSGAVTITSSTLSGNSTLGDRAQGGGISTNSGTMSLSDSTLSGNFTVGDFAFGGGIWTSTGTVTFFTSAVQANSTAGFLSHGGGIYASTGLVTLTGSTLSDNRTRGINADGGGIIAVSGGVTLIDSTLRDNNTLGSSSQGGGIITQSGSVSLTRSSLHGNSTAGDGAAGGGIWTNGGAVTLNNSTISGNRTSGGGSTGGGIRTTSGTVSLVNSTLSGNRTTRNNSDGGGIYSSFGAVTLSGSTVTSNVAARAVGGIYVRGTSGRPLFTIENSIVAGNADNGTAPDLRPNLSSTPVVIDSLIGDTTGSGITPSTGPGNVLNQQPMLGPLANNGGPTQTHALLPGSPALNVGSSSEAYDQRGAPFDRDDGNGVDIGAFESQGFAPQVSNIIIDDGTAQRSVVRSITVNFDSDVIFDAGAFDLKDDQNNPVDVTTSVAPGTLTNQVVMTFHGAGADASGSLLDADYTLRVLDTKIRNGTGVFLDGDNSGGMGGDAVDSFYRLFGDANGDEFTDFTDFAQFLLPAFGTEMDVDVGYLAVMDFDNNGFVDFDDFANGFLPNFGKSR